MCNKEKSALVKELIHKQGKTCLYCGKKINRHNMTLNHLTPLSRGGQAAITNLALCCDDCSNEKGNMTNREYRKYLITKKLLTDEIEVQELRNLFMYRYSSIKKLSPEETIDFLRKNIESYKHDDKFSLLKIDKLIFESEGTIDINDIKIFSKFKHTPPHQYKIKRALKYYNAHKEIDKPLTIVQNDGQNILVDGYARFIALQKLNVPYAPAKFYSLNA